MNQQPVAQQKAAEAAIRLGLAPHAEGIDPLLLLALASLIIQLVQSVMKCVEKPATVQQHFLHLGARDHLLARWLTWRRLRNTSLRDRSSEVASLLETMALQLSTDEIATLHREATE